MNGILTIFRREFRSFFSTPAGFVFVIFYILVSNGYFFIFRDFFEIGIVSMRPWFSAQPWILLVFVPVMAVRLWSEETRVHTADILLSLPLRHIEIILGKFLAGSAVLTLSLAGTLTVPLSLRWLGQTDPGIIAGGYLGTFFIAHVYLAIGLWLGSMSAHLVTGCILSVFLIALFLLAGIVPVFLNRLGPLVDISEYLSMYSHFSHMIRGIIDSRDVSYFAATVAFFLFLNALALDHKKGT